MHFYNVDLPDSPHLLDSNSSWKSVWLGFVSENPIDVESMRLKEGETLGSFDPNNQPTGIIRDIAVGCGEKELITISDAHYIDCEKEHYPDWLKKRLLNPDYQHEIWLSFITATTGFLRVCWNHKGVAGTKEIPCVHFLHRYS